MMNSGPQGQGQQQQQQPPQGSNPIQQIIQVISLLVKRLEAVENKLGMGQAPAPEQPAQPAPGGYGDQLNKSM